VFFIVEWLFSAVERKRFRGIILNS